MATSPFQNFIVRFSGGERIFSEGDIGTTMYIVQSGKIRLFRQIDGAERVHGMLDKGDFFGEMSILEGRPRTHSAEALEDTELIEVNSMTFDKMIKGNIEIAIRMLRKLSLRLAEAERRVEVLQSPDGRPAPAARAAASQRANQDRKATGVRLEVEDHSAVFPLLADETLIGRYDPVTDMRPDVDLTPVDLKRSVSRHHARIVRSGDGYAIIEEIGALKGTFVNGEKLVTGRSHPIRDGDKIGVGMVKLVFKP